MKKIISLMLIAAMLAGMLVSCGNTQKSPEGNDNIDNNGNTADGGENPDSESGEADGEQKINPNLPNEDFGGYTFTFLTHLYDGDDWVGPLPLEIMAAEETGEPINDAVYRRNMKITEKYNFKIDMVANADEPGAMKKSVSSGDSIYDAAIMFNNNVPGIVTGDLLTNISSLPYIDLTKPWWDPAVNSMSIDNKNYLLAGDLLILDNEATNSVLFNKALLANLGLDLPYDLVKAGKWTMDKFNEYIRGASSDLNGDGQMKAFDDRWGFISFNDTMLAFLVGGGGSLALKDENDIPYINFTSPHNLSVIEKLMDIMYNKDDVLNVQADLAFSDWGAAFYNSFEENRSVFQWARLRVVERFRGMESEFGILPMPKFDENQENYHSVVNPYTGVLLGVPKSADNLERVSIILEALAAESKYTLQPAYYDIALQRKYARDEESGEMLDIIFSTRVYDIGAVYSFGGVYMDFVNMANKSNRDVASFYEKNSGKMERAIEKVVGIFQSMD